MRKDERQTDDGEGWPRETVRRRRIKVSFEEPRRSYGRKSWASSNESRTEQKQSHEHNEVVSNFSSNLPEYDHVPKESTTHLIKPVSIVSPLRWRSTSFSTAFITLF